MEWDGHKGVVAQPGFMEHNGKVFERNNKEFTVNRDTA